MGRLDAVLGGGGRVLPGRRGRGGARMGSLLLACLALTSGCSSSSTSNAVSQGGTASGGASTSAASTPSMAPSSAMADARATAALLTPQDIGTGFSEAPYSPGTAPLPCAPAGSPTLDQQVPPSSVAGRTIVGSSTQATLVEELKTYSSEAVAAKALSTAEKGLQCTSGHVYAQDGTAVAISISAPQDVTAALGVPGFTNVTAWTVKSAAVQGDLLVAQEGNSLVFMTFLAPPSSAAKLPNPGAVAQKALEKIHSMPS